MSAVHESAASRPFSTCRKVVIPLFDQEPNTYFLSLDGADLSCGLLDSQSWGGVFTFKIILMARY